MKYLILAAIAIVGVVGVTHKKHDIDPEVRIVEQMVVHPTGCEKNPLMPEDEQCTSIKTVFENLRYKPVEAIVSCGSEMDESNVVLPPRTRLTVTIEVTVYVPDPSCKVKSWQDK